MTEQLIKALEARIQAGMTITEIAESAGISRPNLSRFLGGHLGMSMATADRLVEALGLKVRIR